jgi:hypothetical protein
MSLGGRIASFWVVVPAMGPVRLVNLAGAGPVAVWTPYWATAVQLLQRDKGPVEASAPYSRTWFWSLECRLCGGDSLPPG